MSNIIFLDIDGVLLPTAFARFTEQLARLSQGDAASSDEYMEYFAPYCVDNLRTLLQRTGAGIVFSSNRKNDEGGPARLLRMWPARYGFGTVVGVTPRLDNQQHIRGDEIRRWLAENPTESYLILDDMGPAHFHEEQLARLVQCDEKLGFTRSALQRALGMMPQPSLPARQPGLPATT